MNQKVHKYELLFDKYYTILLIIPILILIVSLFYIGNFYSKNKDFMYRDVSLKGGTVITIRGDIDSALLEEKLKEKISDINLRKLTDIKTGKNIALIIESSSSPDLLRQKIEESLGYHLNDEDLSIEFTGSVLSTGFYKQLIIALVISFVLMSFVIFFMFRTFVPSIAVIFAAFSDIVMPLALLLYLKIEISAAGIAAFLMLIGYSVDTDILLTTRAIKNREGTLNSRIYKAFRTGIMMTLTALAAVLPAFFIVTGLPDSFRQIFLILALGLSADIINTWLTNVGIIKWYANRKGIN